MSNAIIAAILLSYTIFQLYFTFAYDALNIRVIVISVILAVLFWLTALVFIRNVPRELRFSHWFTASPFVLFGLFMVLRTIFSLILPPTHDLMAPNILHAATFMMAMITMIAATFGFITLNSERLEEELKSMQLQLEKMASTDFLTGIANNRLFSQTDEQEIQRARRHESSLSVLMLDLDHFKIINDKHGHAAGDNILASFVGLCKTCLRDTDFFGRLGGEEFAVLLPETTIQGAKIIAERLRKTIAGSEMATDEGNIRITVSIGAAQLTPQDDNLTSLLKRADFALYEAKRKGRNQVAVAP